MSVEQLKAFLEAVKADATLQEKLNAAVDADAVVAIAVTFRKVVTPWLPLRRPEPRVTPGPVRALPVACLSTLLPVDSSNGWHRSSALDWHGGRPRRHQCAAGKLPWQLHCGAGGASRI